MWNNFVQYQYKPCHKIYTHPFSNFSIYLGDVSSALDLNFIRNQPINLVLTAAAGMDQVSYPNNQAKHIVYPLLDAKSQNITQFFSQFYHLVQSQIKQGNILVHCAAGISRSATLVISYLMKKNHWTFKQAVKFVRDKRPIILPNLGFERQLKQFQLRINREPYNSQFVQKILPKNDKEKNYDIFSPIRRDLLPDINNLGQTTNMRSKALQKTTSIKLDPDQVREYRNINFGEKMRKREPETSKLKKKRINFGHLNKEIIFAKIQSGRSKFLQKSCNLVHINFPIDNNTFYQEAGDIKSKKLSSLSYRSDRKRREHKLYRNLSNKKQVQNSSEFQGLNRVIASKLHLNGRNFVTEKNLKPRGVQMLGNF